MCVAHTQNYTENLVKVIASEREPERVEASVVGGLRRMTESEFYSEAKHMNSSVFLMVSCLGLYPQTLGVWVSIFQYCCNEKAWETLRHGRQLVGGSGGLPRPSRRTSAPSKKNTHSSATKVTFLPAPLIVTYHKLQYAAFFN